MVALATTTPPLSPEDQHLLERYIHHNENLTLLAAELSSLPLPEERGRGERVESPATAPNSPTASPVQLLTSSPVHPPSFLSLLTWTAKPHIAPYIALYRAHITHLDKRETIQTLKDLLRTTEDPIEKRRAATTLLRALANQLHPSRPKSEPTGPSRRRPNRSNDGELIDTLDDQLEDADLDGDDGDDADHDESRDSEKQTQDSKLKTQDPSNNPDPWAPYHPKAFFPVIPIIDAYANKPGQIDSDPYAPLPDPCRQPSDVALLVLKAIQSPDDPTDGAGPRILFNLQGYIDDRSLEAFDEYKDNYLKNVVGPAWNHTAAELTHLSTTQDKSKFRAWLTLTNQTIRPLNITLERIPSGTLKDCWVIDHIFFDYTSTGKPEPPEKPPDPAAIQLSP